MATLISRILTAFHHCKRGAISAEVAVALPIMTGLLLSGVEITRYVFIHQKTERAATSIADLVAREEIMTTTKLADVFEITGQILVPFQNDNGTQVIISSVTRAPNGSPRVSWQRSWGPNTVGSRIGAEGDDATLPNGMVMAEGDNVIATEIFYDFSPVFVPDLVQANTIYKNAVYRPRFSSLATLVQN